MKTVILDSATFGDISLEPLCDPAFGSETFALTTAEETAARIADANVVVSNKVRIGKAEMEAAPNLKLICVAATGTNNVDLKEAGARAITVTNVPGYSSESCRAHTLAMYFYLSHKLPYLDQYTKSGNWSKSRIFTHLDKPFRDPSGQVWGIVGLGNIGRAVAESAAHLGFQVVYHSTSGNNTDGPYPHLSLKDLLEQSDVVSIHAPLNEHTHLLFNQERLAWMKSGAILINTSRGPIIDENALAEALNHGTPSAAALDVLSQEPPNPDHPLFNIDHPDRLIVTPHVAGLSIQARRKLVEEVGKNIHAFLNGEIRNHVSE